MIETSQLITYGGSILAAVVIIALLVRGFSVSSENAPKGKNGGNSNNNSSSGK